MWWAELEDDTMFVRGWSGFRRQLTAVPARRCTDKWIQMTANRCAHRRPSTRRPCCLFSLRCFLWLSWSVRCASRSLSSTSVGACARRPPAEFGGDRPPADWNSPPAPNIELSGSSPEQINIISHLKQRTHIHRRSFARGSHMVVQRSSCLCGTLYASSLEHSALHGPL